MVLVSEVDCVSVSLSCQCSIEWFHFACVGLTTKPRGKWYVPQFWSCLLLFRVLPLQFGKRTPLLYVLDSIINLFSPCHYPPSLSICRYCPRCSQERKKKWVPWSEKRWRERSIQDERYTGNKWGQGSGWEIERDREREREQGQAKKTEWDRSGEMSQSVTSAG